MPNPVALSLDTENVIMLDASPVQNTHRSEYDVQENRAMHRPLYDVEDDQTMRHSRYDVQKNDNGPTELRTEDRELLEAVFSQGRLLYSLFQENKQQVDGIEKAQQAHFKRISEQMEIVKKVHNEALKTVQTAQHLKDQQASGFEAVRRQIQDLRAHCAERENKEEKNHREILWAMAGHTQSVIGNMRTLQVGKEAPNARKRQQLMDRIDAQVSFKRPYRKDYSLTIHILL